MTLLVSTFIVPTSCSSPFDQHSTRLHEHGTVEAFRWPHDCSPPACSGLLLRARHSTKSAHGRLWYNWRVHIFSRHHASHKISSMIERTCRNPGQRTADRRHGWCRDWIRQQPTCYSLGECSVCPHRARHRKIYPEHPCHIQERYIVGHLHGQYKILWRLGHTCYSPHAHKDDCRYVSHNKGDEQRQMRCIPEFDKASHRYYPLLRTWARWVQLMLQAEIPLSLRV
mmetsp:Transcript_16660/g.47809  ORF Transcript_16660/g.47809 Transcript_16660/m.47809 type:complete len:226 (+) Transcript_16660:215-892(+)